MSGLFGCILAKVGPGLAATAVLLNTLLCACGMVGGGQPAPATDRGPIATAVNPAEPSGHGCHAQSDARPTQAASPRSSPTPCDGGSSPDDRSPLCQHCQPSALTAGEQAAAKSVSPEVAFPLLPVPVPALVRPLSTPASLAPPVGDPPSSPGGSTLLRLHCALVV